MKNSELMKNSEFLFSTLDSGDAPSARTGFGTVLPEVAFAGRSNVGKSSLINHLLRRKNLAFVSNTPGKTQLINFYNVDDNLCLVDLPGYGFANVPSVMKKKWAKAIDEYVRNRENLEALLLLIDIRRTPCEEDLMLVEWASHYNKQLLIIFTKCDKIKKAERKNQIEENLKHIREKTSIASIRALPYSIKENNFRTMLCEEINRLKYGTPN